MRWAPGNVSCGAGHSPRRPLSAAAVRMTAPSARTAAGLLGSRHGHDRKVRAPDGRRVRARGRRPGLGVPACPGPDRAGGGRGTAGGPGTPLRHGQDFDPDKMGHALDLLLRRAGFPVDVVLGEEEMPGAEGDWSYGPPRCLTPEQVRAAAEALAATPPARLTEGVPPAGLAAAGVHPAIVRERGEPLDEVTAHHDAPATYLRAAARDGDGVPVRISRARGRRRPRPVSRTGAVGAEAGSVTGGRGRAGPPRWTRRCRPSRPSWWTRSSRRAGPGRSSTA